MAAGLPQPSAGAVEGTLALGRTTDAASVVVWLEPAGAPPPLASGFVDVDQRGLAFVPGIVAVPAGTTVRFRNGDTVPHNVFAPDFAPDFVDEPFNLGTWSAGEVREHRFSTPGVSVILCSVHPEMEAFIVVTPGPWFAVPDTDGDFRIDAVPDGEYRVVAWHPQRTDAATIRIRNGATATVSLWLTRPR